MVNAMTEVKTPRTRKYEVISEARCSNALFLLVDGDTRSGLA